VIGELPSKVIYGQLRRSFYIAWMYPFDELRSLRLAVMLPMFLD
jgi:hypothetical protein